MCYKTNLVCLNHTSIPTIRTMRSPIEQWFRGGWVTVLWLLPQSKNIHAQIFKTLNCPFVWMWEWMACLPVCGPAVSWSVIQGISCHWPMTSGRGSSRPLRPCGPKQAGIENGLMDGWNEQKYKDESIADFWTWHFIQHCLSLLNWMRHVLGQPVCDRVLS